MNILIISQVFYPDTVSVSQHISDLAFKLTEYGNNVTVLTSRYPYEEKSKIYKQNELINGVKIIRLYQSVLLSNHQIILYFINSFFIFRFFFINIEK
jgi:hypothetical protein